MLGDPEQVCFATLDSSTAPQTREFVLVFPIASPFASSPPFTDPDLFLSLEQRVENIPVKDHLD